MMTEDELRREVDRIERHMLDDPTAIEALRPARAAALAAWIRAEEAAEQELTQVAEQEPLPSLEERWQLYKDYRILGRRNLSVRSRAKALRLLGPAVYRSIPW